MTRQIGLLLILGLGLGACDESEPNEDSSSDLSVDTTAPVIELAGLTAYQAISGAMALTPQVKDDVGVASVELRVNGVAVATSDTSPFELSWNTVKTADGLVNVSVKATDLSGNTAETPPLRVAVLNGGIEATLENDGVGEMIIPANYDGTQEVDIKHHWVNEVSYAKAIGVITWQKEAGQSDWELELAMGEGACPHAGVLYEDGFYSDTGAVEAEVIPEQGWAASTQFFIHGKPMNAMDHKGEVLPYKMHVFLLHSSSMPDTATDDSDISVHADCPLNSGYPCRCDNVAACEDGTRCVAFKDGTNTGLCSATCTGEEDTTSCAATLGFGLFGYCGAGKDPQHPDHCVVVCEDNGQSADCPPGFECNSSIGVCLPS